MKLVTNRCTATERKERKEEEKARKRKVKSTDLYGRITKVS